MKVRVLYFAAARELTSVKDEQMSLDDGTSIQDLSKELVRKHPALGRMERSLRFSVNLEVADGNSRIRDGDEVGVLPPVAGG